MGVSTVMKDYGTDILNAIKENNLQRLKQILEKHLGSEKKIEKLCTSDIKHKPSKKFACPLILAARQDDPRILKYMLDKGVDPNFVHHTIFSSKRREVVTPLHIAVDLQFYDNVEVLLTANADCNIGDHNQETPLHIAVKKADGIMTRMLLSNGADPTMPDRYGNPALHMATAYGHLQLVRSLLKYDADVYQKGQWGAIPPQIAAKEGHIHLIQLFCSRDVGNINIKIPCYADQREKAPIHLAAEHGHVETVLALLDQFDAEVNLKDSDGNTPLHNVVLNQYNPRRMRDKEYFNETARVLIKYHVAINEKNIFGDTALHLAAMNQFQRIVEMLLDVGANPFIENEEGLKAIDVVPDTDPVTKNVLKDAMLHPRRSTDNLTDRSSDRSSLMQNGHDHSSSQGSHEFNPDESIVTTSSLSSVFENKNQKRPLPGLHGQGLPVQINTNGQPPQKQSKQDKGQSQDQNQRAGPVYTKVDKKGREQPPQLAQIVNNVGPPPNSPPTKMPPPPPVNPPPPLTPQTTAAAPFSTFRGPDARYKDTAALIHQTKPVADPRQANAGMAVHPGTDTQGAATGQQYYQYAQPNQHSSQHQGGQHAPGQPAQYVQSHRQQDQYAQPGHPGVGPHSEHIGQYQQGRMINQQTGMAPPSKSQSTGVQAQTAVGTMQTQTSMLDNKGKNEYANFSEEIQASINQRNKMMDANMNTEEYPAQGIHVQTIPGKPGTIEVTYDGGPITISVDTQGNYAPTEETESQYSNQYQQEHPEDVFSEQYTEEFSEGPSMEIIEDSKGMDARPNTSINTSFDSSEEPYANLPPEPDVTNAIHDTVRRLTEPVPAPRPRKSVTTEQHSQKTEPVPAPKVKIPPTIKQAEREEEMDDYSPDESPNASPKHKSYSQISQMWKNKEAKNDMVATPESKQWKVKKGAAMTVTQDDTLEDSQEDITESTIDFEEHLPPSPVVQKAKQHPQDSHEMYYSITQQAINKSDKHQQPFVEKPQTRPHGEYQETQHKPEVIYANLDHLRNKQQKDSDLINDGEEPFSNREQQPRNLRSEPDPQNENQWETEKPPAHSESLDSLGSWDSDDRPPGPQIYMKVTGDTPQSKTRKMNKAARTAFMKAPPAIIESSSEASDTEFGSRASLASDSSAQLRWKEDLKQYYQKPDKEEKMKEEKDAHDDKTSEKKRFIGLPKPYKSFGKIEVETSALVPGIGLVGDGELDDEPFEPRELPRLGSFSSPASNDTKTSSQSPRVLRAADGQTNMEEETTLKFPNTHSSLEQIRYGDVQAEEIMDDTSEVSTVTDPASSIDDPIMTLTNEPIHRGVPQRPLLPGRLTGLQSGKQQVYGKQQVGVGLPHSTLKNPALQQVANEDNILSVSMESSEFDEDAELRAFNESPLSTVDEQSPEPTATALKPWKSPLKSPIKRPTDRAPSPPRKKPGTAGDKPKPALKPKPGQAGGTPLVHSSPVTQRKDTDIDKLNEDPQVKTHGQLNLDGPPGSPSSAGRRGPKPSIGPKPSVVAKPAPPPKPKEREATRTPGETNIDNIQTTVASAAIGAAINQQISPRHQQRINRQSIETCIDDVMEPETSQPAPISTPTKSGLNGLPRKSTPSPIRSSPPVQMGLPGQSAFTPPPQRKVFQQKPERLTDDENEVSINDSEDDEVAQISQAALKHKDQKSAQKAKKAQDQPKPGQHVYVNFPARPQQPGQGIQSQTGEQGQFRQPKLPVSHDHDEGFHPTSPPGRGPYPDGQVQEEFSDNRYQHKGPIQMVQEEFSDPRYQQKHPELQVQEEFSDPRYQKQTKEEQFQEEFSDTRYLPRALSQQVDEEFSDPRYQQQTGVAQQQPSSKTQQEPQETKGGFFKLPSIRKKKKVPTATLR